VHLQALEIGHDFIIADGMAFNGGVLGALGQPERGVRLLAAAEPGSISGAVVW
jgi:hypothetical protein